MMRGRGQDVRASVLEISFQSFIWPITRTFHFSSPLNHKYVSRFVWCVKQLIRSFLCVSDILVLEHCYICHIQITHFQKI